VEASRRARRRRSALDFDRPAVPNYRIYRINVGAKPYFAP
jgi:hypothetical protein